MCQTCRIFCSTQSRSGLDAGPFRSVALRCRSAACGVRVPGASDSKGTEAGQDQRSLPTPASLLRRYVAPDHRLPPRIDWVNAACLLFPAVVFRDIGGFDEKFYMYCEDVDLCLRLQLQGYLLMETEEATVVHEAQRASHQQWRHCMWHLASLWRLWHSDAYRDYRLQRKPCQKS